MATTRTMHYFATEITDVAVMVCGRHGIGTFIATTTEWVSE